MTLRFHAFGPARTPFLLALFAVLLFASPHRTAAQYAASPLTQLSLHSDPGDDIGQGQDHVFNANDGYFTPSIGLNSAGKVAGFGLHFTQGTEGEDWNVLFSSQTLGTELTPGVYSGAERLPFAEMGHPGLEVSGDHRASDSLTGTFTVTEAVYDYSSSPPTLVSFAATFEQHSGGGTAALRGSIYYHSNTHPQVLDTSHPDTTASLTGTIGKYGRYSGPVQMSLSATDPDGASDVAATYYTLDGGAQQTYTAPFTVSVDGLHFVRFYSVDQAGNQEVTKLQMVWIDRAPLPSVSAQSRLIMHSQPGDFIGQGQDYLYTDGVFSAQASVTQPYGRTGAPLTAVNTLSVIFNSSDGMHHWTLDFTTQQLGTPIKVGVYENAMREAFPSFGHPGLEVSGDGSGSNTLNGKFSIIDLVLDSSQSAANPRVVSFAATFEQHSEGSTPALTGTIYYHSTAYVGTPVQVTVSPAPIPSGQPMGTVTLATPAPAGGETVTLSSDMPNLVGVPATVAVPAGTLSASFPVNMAVAVTPANVQVSASANGVSQAVTLPVQPSPGWTATALVPGPDGKTHVQWNHADGAVVLWTLNPDGSLASHSQTFGPYSGWTPRSMSVGPDASTQLLWTSTDGRMTLWTFPANGSAPSYSPYYGPFSGWTATSLATGTDGKTHVLWNSYDGRMTLWTFLANGSAPSYSPYYGPYSGWTAKAIAAGPDSSVHVLWNNYDGRMTLWKIPATGSPSYSPYYGPYDGWAATGLSVDGGGTAHVLWNNASGAMTLWKIPATGSPSYSPYYGPYDGWSAVSLGVDGNGNSHVLWDNLDGRITPWTLDTNSQFVGTFPLYGPY